MASASSRPPKLLAARESRWKQSRDGDREEPCCGEDVTVGEVDQLDDAVHHRVSDCDERIDRSQHQRVANLLPHEREAALLVRGERWRPTITPTMTPREISRDARMQRCAPDGPSACSGPLCLVLPGCESALLDERSGRRETGRATDELTALPESRSECSSASFPLYEKGRARGALPLIVMLSVSSSARRCRWCPPRRCRPRSMHRPPPCRG